MTRCNIILLEDNRAHCDDLTEDLKEEYDHIVNSFRDQRTFQEACADGSVLNGFDSDLPTIVLMDIMMAEDLDAKEPFAPRSSNLPDDTNISETMYCDDNLGLTIAMDIRGGKYKCVEKGVPILFFTGRQMDHVIDKIESDVMMPAFYLEKPKWIDEVQDAIEQLLKKAAQ